MPNNLVDCSVIGDTEAAKYFSASNTRSAVGSTTCDVRIAAPLYADSGRPDMYNVGLSLLIYCWLLVFQMSGTCHLLISIEYVIVLPGDV